MSYPYPQPVYGQPQPQVYPQQPVYGQPQPQAYPQQQPQYYGQPAYQQPQVYQQPVMCAWTSCLRGVLLRLLPYSPRPHVRDDRWRATSADDRRDCPAGA